LDENTPFDIPLLETRLTLSEIIWNLFLFTGCGAGGFTFDSQSSLSVNFSSLPILPQSQNQSTELVEVLALVEYVTTYFKEQLETLSYPLPVRQALALNRL
jgi:hypothetical protein